MVAQIAVGVKEEELLSKKQSPLI